MIGETKWKYVEDPNAEKKMRRVKDLGVWEKDKTAARQTPRTEVKGEIGRGHVSVGNRTLDRKIRSPEEVLGHTSH